MFNPIKRPLNKMLKEETGWGVGVHMKHVIGDTKSFIRKIEEKSVLFFPFRLLTSRVSLSLQVGSVTYLSEHDK